MKHILMTVASIVLVIFLLIGLVDIKTNVTGAAAFNENLDYQIKSFLGVKGLIFSPSTCTVLIEDYLNKITKVPVQILNSYTTDTYKKIIFQQGRTKGTLEINVAEKTLYFLDKYYFISITTETPVINTIEIKNIFLLLEISNNYAFAKNGKLILPESAVVFSNVNGEIKCEGYPYRGF